MTTKTVYTIEFINTGDMDYTPLKWSTGKLMEFDTEHQAEDQAELFGWRHYRIAEVTREVAQ